MEKLKQHGVSIGVAIIYGITAIIVAALIVSAIIFANATKVIRDLDIDQYDGFEIQINDRGTLTVVEVTVLQEETEVME